jgi:hypothetical protein
LFLMEGDHLKAHLVSPDWTQSKWNEVDWLQTKGHT